VPDIVSALRTLALRSLGLSPLLALSACDDSTPALRIYPTLDACQVDYSAADCAKAYAGAEAVHYSSAPSYGTLVDCEQVYGASGCSPDRQASGQVNFLPLMTGFMIGQALGSPVYQPIYVNALGMAYAGNTMLGTYMPECVGYSCSRSAAAYVSAPGGVTTGTFWSGNSFSTHYVSISHSSSFSGHSAITAHESSISRGGFGSIGRSIGRMGG
jgi:uncharacterized protein YgiB involved in biofilm formation